MNPYFFKLFWASKKNVIWQQFKLYFIFKNFHINYGKLTSFKDRNTVFLIKEYPGDIESCNFHSNLYFDSSLIFSQENK